MPLGTPTQLHTLPEQVIVRILENIESPDINILLEEYRESYRYRISPDDELFGPFVRSCLACLDRDSLSIMFSIRLSSPERQSSEEDSDIELLEYSESPPNGDVISLSDDSVRTSSTEGSDGVMVWGGKDDELQENQRSSSVDCANTVSNPQETLSEEDEPPWKIQIEEPEDKPTQKTLDDEEDEGFVETEKADDRDIQDLVSMDNDDLEGTISSMSDASHISEEVDPKPDTLVSDRTQQSPPTEVLTSNVDEELDKTGSLRKPAHILALLAQRKPRPYVQTEDDSLD